MSSQTTKGEDEEFDELNQMIENLNIPKAEFEKYGVHYNQVFLNV